MSGHTDACKASPEQIAYANLLFYGCWGGLLLMILTYLVYITGLLDPYVPLNEIAKYWSLPVHDYLTHAKAPTGWGWALLLNKGDFLNFLGIAFLAGLTLVCYIPLIPAFLRKKDKAFAALALAEILVLALAASGIVGSGGH